MFGYVKPDLPYLYIKDDTLYKSLYCGVCKSMAKFSEISRLSLTYDIAFLSAVLHNLVGKDVEIKKEKCVAHPIVRRPMASRDDLTAACAATNIILAYHKIKDDVLDEKKGRLKLLALSRAKKRACLKYGEIDEIVSKYYKKLRESERLKEKSIDAVCDHSALIMQEVSEFLLKENANETSDKFFYFLGKWIYLIDALDDYDKDVKKGNYNPFYFAFGEKKTKAEFLAESGNDISFIFADIFANLKQAAEGLEWKFNHDLIDNIILKGLPKVTIEVIKDEYGKKKKTEVKND